MGKDIPDINDAVVLDENDPFDAVLIDMVRVNRAKRADYAGVGESVLPFQNFYDSASHVSSTPGLSTEVLIATKQTRLKTLLPRIGTEANESIEDTILDRAVYSVIALALYREGSYDEDWYNK